ncbi:uncharacterized protein RSE6_07610 [Rhynchosporium secalis]|uniref:Uncharacterized protein n=1 Tax=Rhynchosporium secalis TaxID=38038 RepID=A0A1E1MDA5_RHYSE|nr:uncharacterized protein RSE6_07610 [Rhynchosporium secalis]
MEVISLTGLPACLPACLLAYGRRQGDESQPISLATLPEIRFRFRSACPPWHQERHPTSRLVSLRPKLQGLVTNLIQPSFNMALSTIKHV